MIKAVSILKYLLKPEDIKICFAALVYQESSDSSSAIKAFDGLSQAYSLTAL